LIRKIPFSTYLTAPGISNSLIKSYLKSPKHSQIKYPTSAAMDFGTAFHTLLLEPEKFDEQVYITNRKRPDMPTEIGSEVIPLPEDIKVRRGKKWEEFEAGNPGKTILTQKQWDWYCLQKSGKIVLSEADGDALMAMHENINSEHHKTARMLCEAEAEREVSFFWKDPVYGLDSKARYDIWIPNLRLVIDLKTTIDASQDAFYREVRYKRHYDIQAAWYLQGAREVSGEDHTFLWIAVEKAPPYEVGVYEASIETVESGEHKINRLLPEIANSIESGEYRGYPDEIIPI